MENKTIQELSLQNFEEQKIYKKQVEKIKIYKWTLISISVLLILLVLIFFERTLLGFSLVNNDARLLFNFTSPPLKERNFMIIVRMLLLSSFLVGALIKNYINLFSVKERINKYWPFFTLYILYAIAIFLIMYFYNGTTLIKKDQYAAAFTSLIWISLLFIPLYLINAVYEVLQFNYLKKTNPILTYRSKKIIAISLIIKAISYLLITLFLTLIYVLAPDKTYIFVNNKFYDFVNNYLGSRTVLNILITFLVVVVSITLIAFANLTFIIKVINFKIFSGYFMAITEFMLVILFPVLVVAFSFIFRYQSANIFGTKNPLDWFFTLYALVPLLVAITYPLLLRFQKIRKDNVLVNDVIFYSSLLLISSTLLLFDLLNTNATVSLVNLLAASLAILVISITKIAIRSQINWWKTLFITILGLLLIAVLLMNMLNKYLEANANYKLWVVTSNFNIKNIFTILIVAISLISLLNSVVQYIKINQKLKHINQKQGAANA